MDPKSQTYNRETKIKINIITYYLTLRILYKIKHVKVLVFLLSICFGLIDSLHCSFSNSSHTLFMFFQSICASVAAFSSFDFCFGFAVAGRKLELELVDGA